MNEHKIISHYLKMVQDGYAQICESEIVAICQVLLETVKARGKIYICGNGGSSLTASHFASDLNRAFSVSHHIMPAVCLADNVATLTSVANDISYDEVFCHQLRYLLERQDVLVAISGSGNSENVNLAAEFARQNGCKVVAVVGFDGGRLKEVSDCAFHVPISNMQVVEDIHLLFCHLVSTLIRGGEVGPCLM